MNSTNIAVVAEEAVMKVIQYIHEFGCFDLQGTVDEVIANLTNLKACHPGKDLSINIEAYEEYGSISVAVNVYFERDENDKEIAARKALAERQLQYKRIQFERLKAELGE